MQVTFVVRSGSDSGRVLLRAVSTHGISLKDKFGKGASRSRQLSSSNCLFLPEDEAGPAIAAADLILVATKRPAIPNVAQMLSAHARRGVPIVTLMNGVDTAQEMQEVGIRFQDSKSNMCPSYSYYCLLHVALSCSQCETDFNSSSVLQVFIAVEGLNAVHAWGVASHRGYGEHVCDKLPERRLHQIFADFHNQAGRHETGTLLLCFDVGVSCSQAVSVVLADCAVTVSGGM